MIYKNKFLLTGTPTQINIVKAALDGIFFPWEKIKFPVEPVEIGWQNLNGAAALEQAAEVKKHQTGTKGIINGREYTLGIFYTHSGRIYIDTMLVNYPDIAASTVSAEIAHAVDYFLPLTDQQRAAIMNLMHGGSSDDHGHTWWEKYDYGAEYFSLIGEAFMQAFTVSYTNMSFDVAGWIHSLNPVDAPKLRSILGIERTDVSPVTTYENFPPSKVYHRMGHYTKKEGKIITDVTGLTPCKVCKP